MDRSFSTSFRINGAYIDWFDTCRGERQEYITSPWLFNLFMDSCLYDLKEYELGLKMDELSVKWLLYADDQVILQTVEEGSESWLWQKKNESRINAEEIRSLRSMCGVSWEDICRNTNVKERCGSKENVVTRVERGMLR
ncbi:hypothetical protein EVAR_40907_1 [Eumeta japonica]|uniref:Reverse transcriptase domain-containing protein n=1 Tax=Eumeta variegata TaxID=151549 RepID=A0A4C1X3Q3_EUMVA|nr:hypothetical protein EVAR_40907_1 [Eumeta japonica]